MVSKSDTVIQALVNNELIQTYRFDVVIYTGNVSLSGTVVQTYEEETLTGTINNINTVFTTLYNFDNTTIRIYKNGLKLDSGDFSITGLNEVTFTEPPSSTGFTDKLIINYVKS